MKRRKGPTCVSGRRFKSCQDHPQTHSIHVSIISRQAVS
jgi:hypothetical protein